MACERCLCPDICLARPDWCKLAMAPDSPVRDVQVQAFCGHSAHARDHDHPEWHRRQSSPSQEIPPTPVPHASVFQQAKNFAGAMIGFASSGFQVVDEAEQARRLAICHECEHFDRDKAKCLVCGCVAAWKARITAEHCPINKW